MRFSAYVDRQRSRERLTHFSRPLLCHQRRPRDSPYCLPSGIEALAHYTTDVEGTGPAGRLQAQGHLSSFAIRHRGPGPIIPQDVEGTGPAGWLQAQGHLSSFAIRHRGPGHIIPYPMEKANTPFLLTEAFLRCCVRRQKPTVL